MLQLHTAYLGMAGLEKPRSLAVELPKCKLCEYSYGSTLQHFLFGYQSEHKVRLLHRAQMIVY